MDRSIQAREPFVFWTRLHLTGLVGRKTSNIEELLVLLREVPGSSIYHHTHRFLQQHQYLSPEPPNDFAYWLANSLNEDTLGEQLASIDTVQYPSIRALRDKIIETIDHYAKANPLCLKKFAGTQEEFHFMKTTSFIMPSAHVAHDLVEFAEILKKVTIGSIYYHIFEARLRLEKATNDFSYWLETSVGKKELAEKIARLDPYTRTLDNLRTTLIELVEKSIREGAGDGKN